MSFSTAFFIVLGFVLFLSLVYGIYKWIKGKIGLIVTVFILFIVLPSLLYIFFNFIFPVIFDIVNAISMFLQSIGSFLYNLGTFLQIISIVVAFLALSAVLFMCFMYCRKIIVTISSNEQQDDEDEVSKES